MSPSLEKLAAEHGIETSKLYQLSTLPDDPDYYAIQNIYLDAKDTARAKLLRIDAATGEPLWTVFAVPLSELRPYQAP